MEDVEVRPARTVSLTAILFVVMIFAMLAVVLWLLANNRSTSPSEGAPEVGFARDMIVHHAQAVDLAQLLYDRTDNDRMRTIALDMMLTQQGQIGQMQGWLRIWGVPIANTAAPMLWMGMPVDGLMPGMATEEQIAAFRETGGVEADRMFIGLMIPHHESAVHMSEYIVAHTQVAAVSEFANAVITAQQREIAEMQEILTTLGN
jgi:uncharacterized protein (DUF305 family)